MVGKPEVKLAFPPGRLNLRLPVTRRVGRVDEWALAKNRLTFGPAPPP
jgi:hypothetical protein